jgi:hypothetical protein
VVLLRRVGFKTFKQEDDTLTVWSGSAETTQQQVKAALLEGYEKEAVVAVRNKICDTIADVARECEEKNRKLHFLIWNNTCRTLARTVERAVSKYQVFGSCTS